MNSVRQTPDFFSDKEQAQKRGLVYLILFGLVVLATVIFLYLAVAGLLVVINPKARYAYSFSTPSGIWRMSSFLAIIGSLSMLIFIVSWVKTSALKNENGAYELARLLGGRALGGHEDTSDERRALNVVEEMSVASGLPCPEVIILTNQLSINAFAAGFTPQQAVIGLTQGALGRLDRDELQAVVAHEFGHILSGDTRLNMQLAGWLYGLLAIPISGRFLMMSRHLLFMACGALLWVVGKFGHFGAQIIQAAVSRQREYLADSRGAQFTRNPEALARALQKIGGLAEGGAVNTPSAMMFQHMFIACPIKSLFRSHPSLESRIRRLCPTWDGTYLEAPLKPEVQKLEEERLAGLKQKIAATNEAKTRQRLKEKTLKQKQNLLLNNSALPFDEIVGLILPENLAAAAAMLEAWPPSLRRAAEVPLKATAVVATAILEAQPSERRVHQLQAFFGVAWARQILFWNKELTESGCGSRLPLLDLAAPALRRLPAADRARLLELSQAMVKGGEHLSLSGFAAGEVLKSIFGGSAPAGAETITVLQAVRSECEAVLNFLAWQGHPGDRAAATEAFLAGVGVFKSAIGSGGLGEEQDSRVEVLAEALAGLAQTTPRIKRTVLRAALRCLDNDATVTLAEYETLKALGAALGCPLPQLAPSLLKGERPDKGAPQRAQAFNPGQWPGTSQPA